MTQQIHLLAVLACALVYMVLGALWYSPMLFVKRWRAYMGWSEEEFGARKKNVGVSYGLTFLSALLGSFMMAFFFSFAKISGAFDGAFAALLLWVGVVVPATAASYLFEKKPLGLYLITYGYILVSFIASGIILGVWQ